MYPMSVSGQGPFKYLRPTEAPPAKPATQYPKDYRCDACDVHWSTTDPNQQCWSCGGQTEEENGES